MSQTNCERRTRAFADLVERVQACERCPAMAGRRRVLTARNGGLDPKVMFVAEAPGRFGGDRTGVPFTGDQSGRNFGRLLAVTGWTRTDVFITNAVVCNPSDPVRGTNRTPTREELANCREHLSATIAIVDPPVVVALGRVALAALGEIAPHELTLAGNVGQLVQWHGRWLVALYHVGPQAQLHRPWAQQAEDFRALRALVEALPASR